MENNIPSATHQEKAKKMKKLRRWQIAVSLLGVAIIVWGVIEVVCLFLNYSQTETSNDAQIEQYVSPINLRASGYIDKIYFTEHQEVHKGDTLMVLDDREYKIRVMEAEAALKDAQAGATIINATLNYPDGTLANGWLYHLRQQGESGIFRPVNRIDKNTSGLVLCAKNAFAAPLLAGSAHKCYLAIVQGTMPLGPGRVEAPIARRGDSIIGRCVCADGKYSLTEYAVLAAGPGHSLLACWPRTGRTHQIRVHMSYIGHPLAGDTLYGGSDILLRRHALHCGILAFAHPLTGKPLRVECPLPEDMAALARKEKLLTGWQLHSLPCGADPT